MCKTKIKNFDYIGKSEIIPEDFKQVGIALAFFDEYAAPYCREYDTKEIEDLVEGYLNASESGWVKCSCCGASHKHCIVFQNQKTQSLHLVGRTCANTILQFSYSTFASKFETAQTKSLIARERLARNKKLSAIYTLYPNLYEDLTVHHRIIQSIGEGLKKWVKISEKQVALVHKLAEERRSFEAIATPCPTSKTAINLGDMKIFSVSIKSERADENYYGKVTVRWAVHIALVLQHPTEHYKVYCNAPKGSWDYYCDDGWGGVGDNQNFDTRSVMGIEVSTLDDVDGLKAKMKGKILKEVKFSKINIGKDPYFGFGKRVRYES